MQGTLRQAKLSAQLGDGRSATLPCSDLPHGASNTIGVYDGRWQDDQNIPKYYFSCQ